MHPMKTPGPDGMPAQFFQEFWTQVSPSVTNYCLNVLNHGFSVQDVNFTYITLIPKVANPNQMANFRPISLCNVLYKIVAKMIANRLKQVLPAVISEEQSAFVGGRLITDNALIAYEMLHGIKLSSSAGKCAIKLDMSKAYDRIEWGFVQKMLRRLGFDERFIKLIMNCITSVTFSPLINGTPSNVITPERGLRQGDPLSPYIFIICAEALSTAFHRAAQMQHISRMRVSRGGPIVSHLFFADDSLLFCEANNDELERIMEILKRYETASGQEINLYKT